MSEIDEYEMEAACDERIAALEAQLAEVNAATDAWQSTAVATEQRERAVIDQLAERDATIARLLGQIEHVHHWVHGDANIATCTYAVCRNGLWPTLRRIIGEATTTQPEPPRDG